MKPAVAAREAAALLEKPRDSLRREDVSDAWALLKRAQEAVALSLEDELGKEGALAARAFASLRLDARLRNG